MNLLIDNFHLKKINIKLPIEFDSNFDNYLTYIEIDNKIITISRTYVSLYDLQIMLLGYGLKLNPVDEKPAGQLKIFLTINVPRDELKKTISSAKYQKHYVNKKVK